MKIVYSTGPAKLNVSEWADVRAVLLASVTSISPFALVRILRT